MEEDTRYILWRAAIKVWEQDVWWGVGPGHYDYRFRQFRPVEVQMRPGWAHNDYLNALAEWGVVGTTLVASAWVLLGLGVFKTWPCLSKVMTMVTDPQRTHRNIPGRPEVCNVFALHHSFTSPEEVEQIAADCRSAKLGCVDDKKCLAAHINQHFAEFRAKRAELAKDPDYIWDVLGDGAKRASAIADQTLREVKDAIGLP